MSVSQKKIGLKAKSISFTFNCIVYEVEVPENCFGPVFCSNDIKNKDLTLKPTLIDSNNSEVIFSTDNVTPQFYQSILDKSIRGYDEYKTEKDKIYLPGEIVGYIIL